MSFIKFLTFFLSVILVSKAYIKENFAYKEIENFLSTVQTIQGKGYESFNGKKVPFDFIFSLPGKLRLNYNSPGMHVAIIVNKGVFTYYDADRDQKTQLPIDTTFASIFNKPNFSLNDVNVLSLLEEGNKYILTMEKKFAEEEGKFRIFFAKVGDMLNIEKIEVLNGKEVHQIFFNKIEINKKIKGNPFLIPNTKIF